MIHFASSLAPAVEAERAVLGSILLDNTQIFAAAARLLPEDFADLNHRQIFSAYLDLTDAGTPIDMPHLSTVLTKQVLFDKAGGASFMANLTDDVPPLRSVESYVAIVKDRSKRRTLAKLLEGHLETAVTDLTVTTDELVSDVSAEALAISGDVSTQTFFTLKEICPVVFYEASEQRKHGGDGCLGTPTGIPALNALTTGYRDGEFILIGGWPGAGKSSLGLMALYFAALRGIPCQLFSIEMPKEEVYRRLVAMDSGIAYASISDPRHFTKAEFQAFEVACTNVMNLPILIDDSSSVTATQIAARARLAVKLNKVRLTVVDYVQLVDSAAPDERMRVTQVSKALRQFAKATKTPTIALSQLTRPKDHDRNARPTMFHLKESGSLEADSHKVMLLYRPIGKNNEMSGQDEIIVAKHRGGATGSIRVFYNGETMKFLPRV